MSDFNLRKGFDKEMEKLRNSVMKLGGMTADALNKAVRALEKSDRNMADEVMRYDDEIDELTGEIDEQCLSIIARFQPLALDLRTISASIHMSVDLERIADHAVTIAKISKQIDSSRLIKPLIDIPRMRDVITDMLNGAIRAFLNNDTSEARAVCAMDDMVDDLEKQIFRELLVLMMEHPQHIEQGTQLLFVGRVLERAGDHATNLAERIIYMVSGKTVKASEFRRPKTY